MTLEALIALPGIWPWLAGAGVIGIALGLLLQWLFSRRTHNRLALQLARQEQQLADQERLDEEREALMEIVSTRLSGTFGELAQKSMRANTETFLQLAEQNLGARQQKADSALAAREKAVENLIKPLQEALQRSEKQIHELEKARSHAYGGIAEQINNMQTVATTLQTETRNLVTALRRPEVRGQWGEITLRRLVEMAGMVEHCDFVEQETVRGEREMMRPDLIIRMPDQRELVVDVKTPLDAYLSAVEAADDAERQRHLKRHERKVRERINELAKKSYWSQFKNSPEFVILFIPGDQFLSAALSENPKLIDDALRQNIILATPTSFVALLKAVAYGWNQLALAENAEVIRELAVELHGRMAVFSEHLARVGKQLDGSVKAYNSVIGSLERNVLPSTRKFTELGVQAKKPIAEVSNIDTGIRELSVNKPTDDTDGA